MIRTDGGNEAKFTYSENWHAPVVLMIQTLIKQANPFAFLSVLVRYTSRSFRFHSLVSICGKSLDYVCGGAAATTGTLSLHHQKNCADSE